MNTRRKRKLQIFVFLFIAFIVTAVLLVRTCVIVANAGTDETASDYKYYTSIEIQRGDSLWSIAETYMSDEYSSVQDYMEEIKRINHITGDTITQGNYLCIPYYEEE